MIVCERCGARHPLRDGAGAQVWPCHCGHLYGWYEDEDAAVEEGMFPESLYTAWEVLG